MKTVMLQLRTPTGFYGAGLSWQIIIGLKEGRGSTHLKIKGTERIRGKGPRKAHVITRTFSIFAIRCYGGRGRLGHGAVPRKGCSGDAGLDEDDDIDGIAESPPKPKEGNNGDGSGVDKGKSQPARKLVMNMGRGE